MLKVCVTIHTFDDSSQLQIDQLMTAVCSEKGYVGEANELSHLLSIVVIMQ